jgi:hypothetical protein
MNETFNVWFLADKTIQKNVCDSQRIHTYVSARQLDFTQRKTVPFVVLQSKSYVPKILNEKQTKSILLCIEIVCLLEFLLLLVHSTSIIP